MKKLLFCLLFMASFGVNAQLLVNKPTFTHDDTLRGSITKERIWWDLKHYALHVSVQPKDSTFSGFNTITYQVLQPSQVLQVDLQQPLIISKIVQDGVNLKFKRDGNAFFVTLQKPQKVGKTESLTVYYQGKPRVAKRAPWDGGISWSKDKDGKLFMATSCQGLGASVWWPCKDHMYDEPDSMSIAVTVPKGLMDVSNGRLRSVKENSDNTTTFVWAVVNPINNYGVNLNIANYYRITDKYFGEKGPLDLNYYVLPENYQKAMTHFNQAKDMLKAFEHWFGPYPFYEDGYKLVEVPYLGMEHQSSVTYGNGYQNGYRGRDLSGTGWGTKWDFIIVHESGHEWFANNITYKDIADMWIHESFTNYSENLFTEYHFGKEAGHAYVLGTRKLISNDRPIIGVYNVNHEGSGDMYYKGGNMLHTIRYIIDNDEKWRNILRGMNQVFYHKTVTTEEIENFLSQQSGVSLSKVFDQYLRTVQIPTIEYKVSGNKLEYRWTTCIDGFDMPVRFKKADNTYLKVKPSMQWQTVEDSNLSNLTVDENFYINSKNLNK
ncbi:M1 family metallopeptidase [Flectobacillus sp. BAB-3569]|uniref:M1 family metallopeptidase n=1 Tax=Flectobacillus sp. BAB-3569 TaxID=1509483 RepID=UPI000BA31902|nr:peptidase M1 [Flectobacillus sp. BAB-3569]